MLGRHLLDQDLPTYLEPDRKEASAHVTRQNLPPIHVEFLTVFLNRCLRYHVDADPWSLAEQEGFVGEWLVARRFGRFILITQWSDPCSTGWRRHNI